MNEIKITTQDFLSNELIFEHLKNTIKGGEYVSLDLHPYWITAILTNDDTYTQFNYSLDHCSAMFDLFTESKKYRSSYDILVDDYLSTAINIAVLLQYKNCQFTITNTDHKLCNVDLSNFKKYQFLQNRLTHHD